MESMRLVNRLEENGSTVIDNQRCHLILATKVMKVYEDQYMYPFYCSFTSLISHMPARKYHMKRVYAQALEYRFGDYKRGSIPSDELMVPFHSPQGTPKGLDSITEPNLENMMECQNPSLGYYEYYYYIKTMDLVSGFGFL